MSIGSFGTNLTPIASGLSAAAGAARMGATTDLTITGGITPSFLGDFTTGSLPSGITFTRASNAWYFNSAGALTQASANQLRFDYNPNTLAFNGALIEEARTNYFLNSTAPVTQTISLATGTYVCWVIGTGSMTSAAGTAVGTGFGAATNAALDWYTSNTFNTIVITTAGTVVFTLAGTVTFAQVESQGANSNGKPSSPIITAGASATRAQDNPTIASANIPTLNTTNSSWQVEYIQPTGYFGSGGQGSYLVAENQNPSLIVNSSTVLGGTLPNIAATASVSGAPEALTINKAAYGGTQGSHQVALNGTTGTVNTNASAWGAPTTVYLGNFSSTAYLNGWLRKVRYFPTALTAAQLQTVTGNTY